MRRHISHFARLGVQKSTVARRLAGLEKALGLPLFHRTGQGLVLTRFGSEVYARSQGLVREAGKVMDFAAERREHISGDLHIVYPPFLGELLIERLAADFALAEPDVRLKLEATSALVDPRTIAADLVLHFRFDRLPNADFIARRIFQSPYVLVAAPRLVGRAPLSSPDDLDRFPKIGFGLGPQSWVWNLSHREGARSYDFTPVLASTQISALAIAARRGVGIAALPHAIIRHDIAEGRLLSVLPDWQPEPVTLFALYPSGRTLSTAARRFIQRLSDRLADDLLGFAELAPMEMPPDPPADRRIDPP